MRLTPPAIGIAMIMATVSSVTQGQRRGDASDPRATALVAQARGEAAGGRFDAANDALETALAVDPLNRQAFALMAEIATRQGLPGKAIRLYREALVVEPGDVAALAGQGEAMVQKGAVTKARENLAKIKSLCGASCPDGERLAASIAKGPPPAVLAAQTTVPAPTPTK